MSCNLIENVSLLMDGALSNKEAAATRSHIATCSECSKTLEGFMLLREALQDYDAAPGDVAQRRALNSILSAVRAPLWRRSIPVPAPLLALLVLAFVGLAVWSFAMSRRSLNLPAAVTLPANGSGGDAEVQPAGTLATDLSRLDHGGRAVIITVPRARNGERSQPGRRLQ